MKKLTLVLLLISMLLTVAAAEGLVIPSELSKTPFTEELLSAAPYGLDVDAIKAQYGWLDLKQAIVCPVSLYMIEDADGAQTLGLTFETPFSFEEPALTLSAPKQLEAHFDYDPALGCYAATDVATDLRHTMDPETRKRVPVSTELDVHAPETLDFIMSILESVTFQYDATSPEGTCSMIGNAVTGALSFVTVYPAPDGGDEVYYTFAGDISYHPQTTVQIADVNGDIASYAVNPNITYDGPTGALKGITFYIRSDAIRFIQSYDAEGQLDGAINNTAVGFYNEYGDIGTVAQWDEDQQLWLAARKPLDTPIPTLEAVRAAVAFTIE